MSCDRDSVRDVHILMVDDHADTSAAMERLLRGLGYQVRTADTMSSALAAAQAEPFHLLISDIGLPDGSGLDLIRELKNQLADQNFTGIALSGFGAEQDIQRSLDAGFRAHLTKPVDLQKLQTLIQNLCG